MCGISGLFGRDVLAIDAMVASQHHRGPDASGTYVDPRSAAALGHNRLSIIDLSDAGRQPMCSADGRYWIAFNGEVYNYLELRDQLSDYPFRSRTDTEVILAAYQKWGEACFDKFVGMFAVLIWDEQQQELLAVRDRFGVKPIYYHHATSGALTIASEIKAIHASGIPAEPDPLTWSTFLGSGLYDHSERTFWKEIQSLPPGHLMRWSAGDTKIQRWYDLAESVGNEYDSRSEEDVSAQYLELLKESVQLRFRSDVPVGVNLSGGLDSSLLLGLIHELQGDDSEVRVFTFATGDPEYDELPWVKQMLAQTRHPLSVGLLSHDEVPALAEAISRAQDEPFGGLPTLAYAKLMARAKDEGITVLLDGQGMDEAWAGYDYYASAIENNSAQVSTVQGTRGPIMRSDCLIEEFRKLAPLSGSYPMADVFPDSLRRVQYRDARHTKLPRALRFNDRISMAVSTELREPFLDHRLFELAFRQPSERKRVGETGKRLLRKIASQMIPKNLRQSPKRPVQTPQREWLRGPLRCWANDQINVALNCYGGQWLDSDLVHQQWQRFCEGESDNSFFVWQWISIGLCCGQNRSASYITPRIN